MQPEKAFKLLLIIGTMIVLAGMSACGSDDSASEEEKPVSRTITTPQGNLTIESVDIKPHQNNPDMQWVGVNMVSEDGTEATAKAIYTDNKLREIVMLRTDDGKEKNATAVSQSGNQVGVAFVVPKTATGCTLLWPDNEPVPLDGLIGE